MSAHSLATTQTGMDAAWQIVSSTLGNSRVNHPSGARCAKGR